MGEAFSLPQFTGLLITWAVVHAVMWRGKAVTEEDVPYPVRLLGYILGSPNATAPAKDKLYQTDFGGGGGGVQERLTQESFTEFSPVVGFNLLADPNASFRNLALNTGFVSRMPCGCTTCSRRQSADRPAIIAQEGRNAFSPFELLSNWEAVLDGGL